MWRPDLFSSHALDEYYKTGRTFVLVVKFSDIDSIAIGTYLMMVSQGAVGRSGFSSKVATLDY